MERESPWGPLQVSDAHVHFFSHRFFETLATQRPGLDFVGIREQLGWQMPPVEPEKLAEDWIHSLDRYSVARAALMASLPGDEESVSVAARKYPDRFFAYAMVNPRAWNPAGFEAIKTVCLFPAMTLTRFKTIVCARF